MTSDRWASEDGEPTADCLAAYELMASGVTLQEIANRFGVSSIGRLHGYLTGSPARLEAYARARLASADALEGEMLNAVRAADPENVACARLIADTLKWTMSKRNHKAYGDRLQVDQETSITHKPADLSHLSADDLEAIKAKLYGEKEEQ